MNQLSPSSNPPAARRVMLFIRRQLIRIAPLSPGLVLVALMMLPNLAPRAEMLAAWKKMNSSSDAIPAGAPAHTNHKSLAGPALAFWKTNFYKYNDNSWFYVEPWYTGTMVSGVAQTQYFTANKKPMTNFFSFRFAISNGWKITVTNFIQKSMNDERANVFVLRSIADGYCSNLFRQPTTNFFKIYTNSFRVSATNTQFEMRLYGQEAKSAWVYHYWTNCVNTDGSYLKYMWIFEGEIKRRIDVLPPEGPLVGGNRVVMTNSPLRIGNGSDITNVTVGGKNVLAILAQATNWVSFTVPAETVPGWKDIVTYSTSTGTLVWTEDYYYNPTGVVLNVSPTSGATAGGYTVKIGGRNFSNGQVGDVTNVTLKGVAVTSIGSFMNTQVVVTAAAGASGRGAIIIDSVSYGHTELAGGWTYEGPATVPGMLVFGTNGAMISSSEAASAAKGTDFGTRALGTTVTNWLSITNDGTAVLNISGVTTSGTGAAYFRVSGIPATVAVGGVAHFSIAYVAGLVGSQSATLQMANDSASATYFINLAGAASSTPGLQVLGHNGAVMTSGEAASVAKGTDFGAVARGYGATNTISITNNGTGLLTISGVTTSGAGAAYFRVSGIPGSLAVGAAAAVKVAFDATVAGTHSAALNIANDSPTTPFVINLAAVTEPGRIGTRVASGVATVGASQASSTPLKPSPIRMQYANYHQQHVYSTAQLEAAGLTNVQITAMGFHVTQANAPHIVPNYRVRLKETARTGWTSSDKNMEASGLALVFSNAAQSFVVGDTANLVLDAAFNVGANTKLLVDCGFALATESTLGGLIRYTNVADSVVVLERDDADALSVFDDAANNVTNILPVMTVAWQQMSHAGVVPASCSFTGGINVTISGTNLCAGTLGDVASVTLCGAAATVVSVEGSTQIVVRAGPGGAIGRGMVDIRSTRMGRTAVANLFTYNPPGAIGGGWIEEGWTEVASLPEVRISGAAATLGSNLYYMGGANAGWSTVMTNVYRFNGSTWSQVAGLPEARIYLAADALNGAIYAAGGLAAAACTNVTRYGGTTWQEVAGLPAARSYLAMANLNSALYAVGGSGSMTAETNVYRYAEGAWQEVTGLPAARSVMAAAALGNALYAVGGIDPGGTPRANVFRYNGTNWTESTALPAARSAMAAAPLNSNVYVFGGGYTNNWRFNGTTWTEAAGLPVAVKWGSAAVLDGFIYSVGDQTRTNVYRYSPGMFTLSGVSPAEGTNGTVITITGSNLCNGTLADVPSVTINWTEVDDIVSVAGSTQIVVVAGASPDGPAPLEIHSIQYGNTRKENAFTYLDLDPVMLVLGTNRAPAASGAAAGATLGTDLGVLQVGAGARTNTFGITNSGLSELNIPSWTTNGM